MTREPDPTPDAEIAALLDEAGRSSSFIDRLMDLPVPSEAASGSAEWQQAVARRLQQRLAASMRAAIEGEPERRSA